MVLQASLAARPQHMALAILKIGFRPAGEGGGAAGQHQLQRTHLNHGARGAGFLNCRAAKHGSNDASTGLLCRPGGLQGSTKCRGHFLIMGLVVQASLAAGHQNMAQTIVTQACCAGLPGRLVVQAWGGGCRAAPNTEDMF